jgi:hypothetical protein
MDQTADVPAGPPAGPQAHLQRVEREVGAQRAGQLPADHPPGEHVGDEGGVDPSGEGSAVGDVGDPQLVWAGRGEGPFNQVQAQVRARSRDRGPRAFRPAQASHPGGAHEPLHRASGHLVALPVKLGVNLPGAVDTEVLGMDLLDQRGGDRVGDRPRRGRPGPLRVVGARGDLQLLADRLDPVLLPVSVDELDNHRCGRSSSAAKKADALFKIAFARRTSRFSRSSSANRCPSSVVVPGR